MDDSSLKTKIQLEGLILFGDGGTQEILLASETPRKGVSTIFLINNFSGLV